MPDEQSISIHVSRIIPAEKWKIIRLLTKVRDFPEYIPCVKETTLLYRNRNCLKTRWKVVLEGIPVSWIEEDTLELKQDCIHFRCVEGDLEEFSGKWTFQQKEEGTQVEVQVTVRVGIPGIKAFTENYVTRLLAKNFESILDSLEKRIISRKYSNINTDNTRKIAGFGIVGHLYNYCHLEKSLKMLKPDFKMPSREFMNQLYHTTPPFKLCDIKGFRSKTGQVIDGCFMVATFIPEMIERDIWMVFSKVVKACKIAEKHGIGIVTLGGFTSIVGEKIGHQVADEVDVPVTTGNSFTAAMSIDGVIKAAEAVGLDIAKARLTIIGGTGDIGSGCARVLADKVRMLTITGKTKANLKIIGKELAKKRKARIATTTNNEKAVRDADIVIAVASSSSAILDAGWFKPGAIICDVGYPKNISYAPITRQDIIVFSGGLAKPPSPISFPIDVGLPSTETLYGCFCESIILGLEQRYENFSYGKWLITPEKIAEIRALGNKHGFTVSDFYWGYEKISQETIEKVRELLKKRR